MKISKLACEGGADCRRWLREDSSRVAALIPAAAVLCPFAAAFKVLLFSKLWPDSRVGLLGIEGELGSGPCWSGIGPLKQIGFTGGREDVMGALDASGSLDGLGAIGAPGSGRLRRR
ncbi:hypothetical protein Droror1_Dr00025959 [Drosera rotundifolia]